MTARKKPDNVVFNSATQSYDASLKAYGTNVGAPVITSTETTAWKNRSINKANQQVQARFTELKTAYDKMMADYELNTLIYNSSFNFEPIVGEVYHLYQRENEATFLSLIAPEHCNFLFMGSFYLNADQIWERQ